MKQVFKYKVNSRETRLDIPEGSKFLTVACQNDDICVWAEVLPNALTEVRVLKAFNTGEGIPEDAIYIGTAFSSNQIVWHVYELV